MVEIFVLMDSIGQYPQIHIFGTQHLQYELLSFCLENELGAQCSFHPEIHLKILNNAADQQVWLLDCIDLNTDKMEQQFAAILRILPKNVFTTLINVETQEGLVPFIMRNRIRGIFFLNDPRQHFLKGIRIILRGQLWLSRQTLSKCVLMQQQNHGGLFSVSHRTLSCREISILRKVASGASNKQIASELCISVHTIKTHLYKIYRKINVRNRLQATMWIKTRSMNRGL